MSEQDWLDAFDAGDLADPELAAVDAAVARVMAGRRRPAPRPRRWGLGLVAAIAAVTLLRPTSALVPAGEVAPPVAVAPVVDDDPPGIDAPTPMAIAASRPRPSAPPPVVAPGPAAGLLPGPGAALSVASGVVHLTAGAVSWVHDGAHDPGAQRLVPGDLPIAYVPVGTAFHAEVRPYVGVVRVTDGVVRVLHDDGTLLAELHPGQEAVAVTDLDSPIEVRLVQTTALPLDALAAQLPPDCLCHPRDVVAAVASARFHTRDSAEVPR